MSETTTTNRQEVLDSESLLHAAEREIQGAIKFLNMRDNAEATDALRNATALRIRITEMLTDCFYTDRDYPDAWQALRILMEACHSHERAINNDRNS